MKQPLETIHPSEDKVHHHSIWKNSKMLSMGIIISCTKSKITMLKMKLNTTSLVSRLFVLHGSRLAWCPCTFFFVKTACLPRLRGERVEASSTILPASPCFAQPRPLLTGPPRGRDPRHTTDLDWLWLFSARKEKLPSTWNKLRFRSAKTWLLFAQLSTGYSASAGAGCHVAAHTDPKVTHRFGCVQVSKAHRQPGPTATAQNSSNWASSFRKRSTFVKLRRRCEPFGCDFEEWTFLWILVASLHAPTPGACWRAARQESICLRWQRHPRWWWNNRLQSIIDKWSLQGEGWNVVRGTPNSQICFQVNFWNSWHSWHQGPRPQQQHSESASSRVGKRIRNTEFSGEERSSFEIHLRVKGMSHNVIFKNEKTKRGKIGEIEHSIMCKICSWRFGDQGWHDLQWKNQVTWLTRWTTWNPPNWDKYPESSGAFHTAWMTCQEMLFSSCNVRFRSDDNTFKKNQISNFDVCR